MKYSLANLSSKDLPETLDRDSPLLNDPPLKRLFDIVSSSLALLVLFPFFALIVLAIKLNSPGPVFYMQPRVGKKGKVFNVWKFRTMTEAGHPVSKKDYVQDQTYRVTKVGKVLRDFGIDELPQLINVLKGEMSVVGPRPQPVPQVELYLETIPQYNWRHEVKPGITGMVQISSIRSAVALDRQADRLQLDLYYINYWSHWLDIEIIYTTVLTILPRYRINIMKYPKGKE
jgi:putative colanic acid biosynthesis UDP-glucose lipid carrier transferase